MYNPIGSNAEEDVLCSPSDLYPDEDITVHEVPHTLCVSSDYTSNLSSSILILCSLRSILLAGEYFAEGMQAYFDVGRKTDKEAPYTRDMLKRQDPQLYTLIDQWMGHNEWIGSCPPS